MKMYISEERTEQNTDGNDNYKYSIRGIKWHLPGDVDVDVAVSNVLFFVVLMH